MSDQASSAHILIPNPTHLRRARLRVRVPALGLLGFGICRRHVSRGGKRTTLFPSGNPCSYLRRLYLSIFAQIIARLGTAVAFRSRFILTVRIGLDKHRNGMGHQSHSITLCCAVATGTFKLWQPLPQLGNPQRHFKAATGPVHQVLRCVVGYFEQHGHLTTHRLPS